MADPASKTGSARAEEQGDGGASKASASSSSSSPSAGVEEDRPKTLSELEQQSGELQTLLDNETDNTTLLAAQLQQSRMIEKTQQAIELRKFKQQIEEYEEMAEDIIDTLYDYEEKLELHGVFLEKSAAEAFEDAKCEVTARAKQDYSQENENGSGGAGKEHQVTIPDNLKQLIQTINQGGASNMKLSKAAEIAAAKSKRLQEKHDQLTELLEEVQNTISASAAHDPREIIKQNRVLKKKIEDLKSLLEESLNGLDSKSDTNLKTLKTKSLKLKKQKNQLVRDIKSINEATANSSAKGKETLEDLEAKLKILRSFKEVSESGLSPAKLKAAAQQCRNDLLRVAVKLTKTQNTAIKQQRKEEQELAKYNPEEAALKRKVLALKKRLKAVNSAGASADVASADDVEGDGPADPVKFNALKKKATLKVKELKLVRGKLKSAQAAFEAATGAGGVKAQELMASKEELPRLKEDVAKAKQDIVDRQKEVKSLIKKMAEGGGTLGVAARKMKRVVRDMKKPVKDLQREAGDQVKGFGPWVQEQLAKVDHLAAERTVIAKKARDNYKKQHVERKKLYKQLVAKQKELGEPIEPPVDSDDDSD